MEFLARDGEYYSPFGASRLFTPLMDAMRSAAAKTLMRFGYAKGIASKKAAHQTVFWVSVHDEDSIHEPHMTKDSLLGGVCASGALATFLASLLPLIPSRVLSTHTHLSLSPPSLSLSLSLSTLSTKL